jgi:hypothetical protein
MRLDAKARALNAKFTALSCNKEALCMRAPLVRCKATSVNGTIHT